MQNKFQAKLEVLLKNNQSFLWFREPQSQSVELWMDKGIETNQQFIFHDFVGDQHLIFHDDEVVSTSITDLPSLSDLVLPISEENEAISKEDYIQLIEQTVEELNTTSTQKIVISRIKEIENQGINLVETFQKLHVNYPKAYLYLWYTPNQGLWMGASPELLLEEEQLTIKTVSLAGTLPKNEAWTSKEIHEQQVVTDYIVSKLDALKNVAVDGPHTIDAGFFNHLKSYISAKAKNFDEVELILNQLHPTPAVCGLPKEEAKAFILANEGYNRQFYAGYFGYKKDGKSLFFVNLRCAKFYQNVVKLYVGGGIMPDSNPEKEWQETEMKSKTIGNLLVTDVII